jgi:hypothetical protein
MAKSSQRSKLRGPKVRSLARRIGAIIKWWSTGRTGLQFSVDHCGGRKIHVFLWKQSAEREELEQCEKRNFIDFIRLTAERFGLILQEFDGLGLGMYCCIRATRTVALP